MLSKPLKTRVYIVDDHPIFLEGIKNFLQSKSDDIELKGGCGTGKEAMEALLTEEVDVLLLDINLPDMNGIDLCKLIKQQHPDINIIAISIYNERSMITKMLQNGATGYILKNASAEELYTAIKTVVNKSLYFSTDVQRSLFEAALDDPLDLPRLTRREEEVLRCIGEGKTTSEMASQLFVSTHTIETHRRNLMQKFNVSNSAALIRMATQYNLL